MKSLSLFQANTQPNQSRWWHAVIKSLAAFRPVSWLLSQVLHHVDRLILQITSGRQTLTGLLTGVPVVWITTIGAKSGRPRTVPVLAVFDEDKVILIASNWGTPRHPAWYYNLRANPQATLTINDRTAVYTAREATQADRNKYWAQAVELYPGWQAYQQRAKNRQFPIIVLSPEVH